MHNIPKDKQFQKEHKLKKQLTTEKSMEKSWK